MKLIIVSSIFLFSFGLFAQEGCVVNGKTLKMEGGLRTSCQKNTARVSLQDKTTVSKKSRPATDKEKKDIWKYSI